MILHVDLQELVGKNIHKLDILMW